MCCGGSRPRRWRAKRCGARRNAGTAGASWSGFASRGVRLCFAPRVTIHRAPRLSGRTWSKACFSMRAPSRAGSFRGLPTARSVWDSRRAGTSILSPGATGPKSPAIPSFSCGTTDPMSKSLGNSRGCNSCPSWARRGESAATIASGRPLRTWQRIGLPRTGLASASIGPWPWKPHCAP
jgi:hypothetical protein